MKIPDELAEQKAGEIYSYLKRWVSDQFRGKDLRGSGPFLTPGYVHNEILAILKKETPNDGSGEDRETESGSDSDHADRRQSA
jgi:hypothetical protein